jgi:hypothetical protein
MFVEWANGGKGAANLVRDAFKGLGDYVAAFVNQLRDAVKGIRELIIKQKLEFNEWARVWDTGKNLLGIDTGNEFAFLMLEKGNLEKQLAGLDKQFSFDWGNAFEGLADDAREAAENIAKMADGMKGFANSTTQAASSSGIDKIKDIFSSIRESVATGGMDYLQRKIYDAIKIARESGIAFNARAAIAWVDSIRNANQPGGGMVSTPSNPAAVQVGTFAAQRIQYGAKNPTKTLEQIGEKQQSTLELILKALRDSQRTAQPDFVAVF